MDKSVPQRFEMSPYRFLWRIESMRKNLRTLVWWQFKYSRNFSGKL